VPDQSLLTPEVRSLIGTASAPVTAEVTRRAVNRAMDVYLGNHDRRFNPGDIVPGFALVALEPEGEPSELPPLMPDSILISNEMEFERPIRLGEVLTLRTRLADINERFGGRFGYSLYFRSEVEFADASGAVVARSARTMMQYDAANATGEGEA
jgi:hypothetical protein